MTMAAAGVINVDTGVRTTTDTLFQIGSITKVMTATLIMQLVDEKQVDLDKPLRTYLPKFRVADPVVSKRVTPRMLLSHQSGIDGDFFPDAGRGEDSVARLVDMGTMLPNLYPPGERVSYCNFGFAVLGRLIEVVDDRTWDESLDERLFKPLSMTHAISVPEETLRFSCAVGHVPHQKKRGVNVVTPQPYLCIGQKAAGSTTAMSVGDLLRFARLHLDGGVTPDGKRLLSRSAVRAMQRLQILKYPKGQRGLSGAVPGVGLAWMTVKRKGYRALSHAGGTVGQYSLLVVLPNEKIAFALLTNGGKADALQQSLSRTVLSTIAKVPEPISLQSNDDVSISAGSLTGVYQNITTRAEVGQLRKRYFMKINGVGQDTKNAERIWLRLLDERTALPSTGQELFDNTLLPFDGFEGGRAHYLTLRGRVLSRVE
jgi:CubicO group peptidase (beta-lactamase class C family)